MRFPKTIFTALVGTALAAAPSFAQDVKVSPRLASPRVTASQPMMLSDLMSWHIVLQNHESVGHISDFVIGPQGDVLFAIGTLNGQSYVIPYAALSIDPNAHELQLGVTPTQFDEMTFFRGRHFPDFSAPAFRKEMTQTFGDRIFNSTMPSRGRGHLGANQTEGSDIQNPAGKAPSGLNRGNLSTNPNRVGSGDPPRATEKETKTPGETDRERTPSGIIRNPTDPPPNFGPSPSGTPNNPLPRRGISPGAIVPSSAPISGK